MLRTTMWLAIAWSAAVFDCGIAPVLMLQNCAPSACMVTAMLIAVSTRSSHGFLLAGGFGLAADLSGAAPLGASMACCSLAGYAIRRLRDPLRSVGLLRASLELIVGTLLVMASLAVVHAALAESMADWSRLIKLGLGAGVYSLALAIPLLALILSMRTDFEPLTSDL